MVISIVGEHRQRGLQIKAGRFAALLDRTGWTMKRVSEIVGVTERQTHRWKTGDSTVPRAAWKVLCDEAGVVMLDDDWKAGGE